MKKWVNAERSLADLVPYKKNPRAHTDEDIDRLADAIKRFGFTAPILIDKKNRVLAGHSRCKAAFKLGMKTVPVRIVGDDWTEAEKQAYTIWDNQSTILGTWDLELLRGELIELKSSDLDLSLLGFSEPQLLNFTMVGISDSATEWVGMPEFDSQDKTAFRSIVVHFKDQGAVDKFAKVFKQSITEKTRFLWYPEIEIERYMDKQYK